MYSIIEENKASQDRGMLFVVTTRNQIIREII